MVWIEYFQTVRKTTGFELGFWFNVVYEYTKLTSKVWHNTKLCSVGPHYCCRASGHRYSVKTSQRRKEGRCWFFFLVRVCEFLCVWVGGEGGGVSKWVSEKERGRARAREKACLSSIPHKQGEALWMPTLEWYEYQLSQFKCYWMQIFGCIFEMVVEGSCEHMSNNSSISTKQMGGCSQGLYDPDCSGWENTQ